MAIYMRLLCYVRDILILNKFVPTCNHGLKIIEHVLNILLTPIIKVGKHSNSFHLQVHLFSNLSVGAVCKISSVMECSFSIP